MDPLTITAAAGMRARIESLDMLANNLANAATAGYKADREFYNLYVSELASGPDPAVLPVIERNWIDFSQGLLTETRQPLDLALEGRGFLVADTPQGPLYTRGGSFRVSPSGVLETREGYALRAVGPRKVIRIAAGAGPVEVRRDGSVWQAEQSLGRLELADFERPESAAKRGHTYFQIASARAAGAGAEVHQGKVESSNVGPAEAAVRLVSVVRQFEMLQRALTLGAEMNRRAVEEVARVSG